MTQLETAHDLDIDIVSGIRHAFRINQGLRVDRFVALLDPMPAETVDERVLGCQAIAYAVLQALTSHISDFSLPCWESVWDEISRPRSLSALADMYRLQLRHQDLHAVDHDYHRILGATLLAYVGQAASIDLESTMQNLVFVFDGLLKSGVKHSPHAQTDLPAARGVGFEVDLSAQMKTIINTETMATVATIVDIAQVCKTLHRTIVPQCISVDACLAIFSLKGEFDC